MHQSQWLDLDANCWNFSSLNAGLLIKESKTGHPGLKILTLNSPFEAGIQIPIHQPVRDIRNKTLILPVCSIPSAVGKLAHPKLVNLQLLLEGLESCSGWRAVGWKHSTGGPSPALSLTCFVILVARFEGGKTRAVVKGAVQRRWLVASAVRAQAKSSICYPWPSTKVLQTTCNTADVPQCQL